MSPFYNHDLPPKQPIGLTPPVCDCQSANNPDGKRPPLMIDGNTRQHSIDACIAPAYLALKAAGIATVHSCCGHGRQAPSFVLATNTTDDEYPSALLDRAYAVIRTVDPRLFHLDHECNTAALEERDRAVAAKVRALRMVVEAEAGRDRIKKERDTLLGQVQALTDSLAEMRGRFASLKNTLNECMEIANEMADTP